MVIKLILIGISLLLLGGLVELLLRMRFGLGTPLIYIPDDKVGYLLAPNQQVCRRGNRIHINSYSMRGDDIDRERSPSTLRILLLGDSIANGGWWTAQDQTISALCQQTLQSWSIERGYQAIEVLNASANSWGPRNELAYIQRFGTFDAQVVVALINTDDLFATAPSSLKVGMEPNYPAQNPGLALIELYQRIVRPRFQKTQLQALYEALDQEEGDRVGFNLAAIRQMYCYGTQADGQFILAHTPLLRELGSPGPRDYELDARQRLKTLVDAEAITYIDFLASFSATDTRDSLYWDHIHLTKVGNQRVVEAIAKHVMMLLDNMPKV